MTRFVIDAPTAVRLLQENIQVASEHQLVAPASLRSQAMSLLYGQVRSGLIEAEAARAFLEDLAGMKIRLLGDRVSRATAWTLAQKLDWDDTAPAEFLAVCVLQADALVTEDRVLQGAADSLGLSLADIGRLSS